MNFVIHQPIKRLLLKHKDGIIVYPGIEVCQGLQGRSVPTQDVGRSDGPGGLHQDQAIARPRQRSSQHKGQSNNISNNSLNHNWVEPKGV